MGGAGGGLGGAGGWAGCVGALMLSVTFRVTYSVASSNHCVRSSGIGIDFLPMFVPLLSLGYISILPR